MQCLQSMSNHATLCDKVCQWRAADQWFSPGTPVSSTNKTERHDITEILLKIAFNTTTPPLRHPKKACHSICVYIVIWKSKIKRICD